MEQLKDASGGNRQVSQNQILPALDKSSEINSIKFTNVLVCIYKIKLVLTKL